MATEDELPKKLELLEITHILPQIKCMDSNLSVHLNPFYEIELKGAERESKIEQKIIRQKKIMNNKTASQNCRRCRFRRASESVLDELKNITPNPLPDSVECTRTATGRVMKQALKKTAASSGGSFTNRKILLREPVLKALQTCLLPHNNVRRKLLASAVDTKLSTNNDTPLTTKGKSDFRDLIDECRNLLLEDVDFSGRLNELCVTNRNSKNFTTMQTPKVHANKSRNKKNSILNTAVLSLPGTQKTLQNEDQFTGYEMSSIESELSSSYITSTAQQRNSILTPEQLTNPVRCSTSCSQQAGNSAAAATCDDVTIDELACYLDTIVHIPKKMSSMAEMMYI